MNRANRQNDLVLVVGLGATGASAIRYLRAAGRRVRAVDSRERPPMLESVRAAHPEVELRTGALDPAALAGVDALLVSPGVDLREPLLTVARERGLEIVGDIEYFARAVTAPVVAITGSNGKSTVTALVGAMAEAAGLNVAVGGNFGTPALDLLAGRPDLYVLELSSFQLELTESLAPVAAAVLNVSPDHIDRHGSLAHYAALKARVFRGAGTAVRNRDDLRVAAMPTGDAVTVDFSVADTADWDLETAADGRTWLRGHGERLCAADDIKLRGRHNLGNALAALALGEAAGLPRAPMLRALREFPGLAHRCQWVARVNAVDYVDDSKGTNVGALLASLEGLGGPIVLLAGGEAKGGDFAPVAPVMAAKGRAAVLFGVDAAAIEAVLSGVVPVHRAANMDDAVRTAADVARPGDTVLLSPGCASFDMFRDYRERGERFVAAVGRLSA